MIGLRPLHVTQPVGVSPYPGLVGEHVYKSLVEEDIGKLVEDVVTLFYVHLGGKLLDQSVVLRAREPGGIPTGNKGDSLEEKHRWITVGVPEHIAPRFGKQSIVLVFLPYSLLNLLDI